MRKLKDLLFPHQLFKKKTMNVEDLLFLTIDASPIGIGWATGQDDVNGNKYVVRFGTKVFFYSLLAILSLVKKRIVGNGHCYEE
jgi:hypothetical protein